MEKIRELAKDLGAPPENWTDVQSALAYCADVQDAMTPYQLGIFDEARADAGESPLVTLWYYIREYSESEEFPEVNIYGTEQEARETMIEEVFTTAACVDGAYVTHDIDGAIVQRDTVDPQCLYLNVQWDESGAVDCFRLGSQRVQL